MQRRRRSPQRGTLGRIVVSLGLMTLVWAGLLAAPPPVAAGGGDDGWADDFFPQGLDGPVLDLVADHQGNIYAGGSFTTAGGAVASRIARWDGARWEALGAGIELAVQTLALAPDGTLYAGGILPADNGSPAYFVTAWNGTLWEPLGSFTGWATNLAVTPDGALLAAVQTREPSGSLSIGIARWTGTTWEPLGTPTLGEAIAVAVGPDGAIYAGRTVKRAYHVYGVEIVRWTGTTWACLGGEMLGYGLTPWVAADGALYAGGWFDARQVDVSQGWYYLLQHAEIASRVARWTGSAWQPLGDTFQGSISALAAAPDGTLYAGGNFTAAGGVTANNIAHWTGAAWEALGSGVDGSVNSLVFDADGTLYVGGSFTMAGSHPSAYIARWTPPDRVLYDEGYGAGWGEQWSWGATATAVGAPVTSGAEALSISYSYGWGGFRMMSAGDNWTGYQTLRFALRGGPSQNIPVRVWLKTAGGSTFPLGVVTAPASRWVAVELALPADPALAAVTELVVQEDRGRAPRQPIFLDRIVLERAAPAAMLYDEGFTPRWQELWSWGASATPVSAPTASGGEALQVSYAYGWGGLRMMSARDDWTGYRALRFAVNGGATGGQQLRVWIKTAGGATFQLGVVTAPPGGYATAELALPAGADLSAVTELVFQEHTGQAPPEPYVLDRVELIR